MTLTQASNILLENIEKLQLPKINRLDHLENQEPTIYLCGKSSTGKTTFLNALFNLERDELFTSTNISTKTEFRFEYGKEEVIKKSDGTVLNLPNKYEERKELFKAINEEGDSYKIFLNQETLKNRVIVDIPGVLDFKRNDRFFNKMLDEADIVYFFTPCTKTISNLEYDLLFQVSEAGIPIIVLFTMGDLTEIDEGITRKTIPQFVQKRLISCFKGLKIEHHQIISSNDFFKRKDSHGINLLTEHVEANDQQYKQNSQNKRLERTVQHYTNLIEDKLGLLKIDSESYRKSVIKEKGILQRTKKKELENENERILRSLKSEINWIERKCKEQILSNLLQEHNPEQISTSSQREKQFLTSWEQSWNELENDFEFLKIRDSKLPQIPENLFEHVTIDTNKLKEFFDVIRGSENKSEKKDDSNAVKSKKASSAAQDQSTASELNKLKSTEEEKKNQSTSDKDGKHLSWTDYLNLAIELGINLPNAKILWSKYTYLNKVQSICERVKIDVQKQLEGEFQVRFSRLEEENHKELEKKLSKDPTLALKIEYSESLNQLKAI